MHFLRACLQGFGLLKDFVTESLAFLIVVFLRSFCHLLFVVYHMSANLRIKEIPSKNFAEKFAEFSGKTVVP